MAKGSLVRFLTVLLNVAWAATIGLLVLSCCLLLVSPWVDPPRVEAQLALPVAFTLAAEARILSMAATQAVKEINAGR